MEKVLRFGLGGLGLAVCGALGLSLGLDRLGRCLRRDCLLLELGRLRGFQRRLFSGYFQRYGLVAGGQ